MSKKPCTHEYLAAGESGKVLMCRDCGVVHLHLQNISMRFEAEQFADLATLLTAAAKNMAKQPPENPNLRPKLTLVH
ncbi:DUF6686 family protein [Methylomonas methanica]|uniref:Uncharacterized protein n=1 Tax=Methylomonas methanica (strain DSM 25384 / MC09) TaxID=857087 RepID=G0A6B6_METMM|nr:DUF6686 family protein [Methylomonas methanica]AEG01744.1 hypothetical protein Metme_3373 [Methylomonas methanica MC09]